MKISAIIKTDKIQDIYTINVQDSDIEYRIEPVFVSNTRKYASRVLRNGEEIGFVVYLSQTDGLIDWNYIIRLIREDFYSDVTE